MLVSTTIASCSGLTTEAAMYRSVSGPKQRQVRFLKDLAKKQPRWEPSREELLEMRRLSRSGATITEAYDAIKPPLARTTFMLKAKAFGIRYLTTRHVTLWILNLQGRK